MLYRVEVYVNEDFAKEFIIQAYDAEEAEDKVRDILDVQLSTEEM